MTPLPETVLTQIDNARLTTDQALAAYCEAQGWRAEKVEWYDHRAKRLHDLWGCIDWVVLDGGPGTLYVQVTTVSNASSRMKKCIKSLDVQQALADGNRVEVWGWRWKEVLGLWALRRVPVTAGVQPA